MLLRRHHRHGSHGLFITTLEDDLDLLERETFCLWIEKIDGDDLDNQHTPVEKQISVPGIFQADGIAKVADKGQGPAHDLQNGDALGPRGVGPDFGAIDVGETIHAGLKCQVIQWQHGDDRGSGGVRVRFGVDGRGGDPAREDQQHGCRGIQEDMTTGDVADDDAGHNSDPESPTGQAEVDDVLGAVIGDADGFEDGDEVI